MQKPISFDVVEGQAMVAAARKYKRTVQVGLERRSTPHILEPRDRYIKSGKLGKIAYVAFTAITAAAGAWIQPNCDRRNYHRQSEMQENAIRDEGRPANSFRDLRRAP